MSGVLKPWLTRTIVILLLIFSIPFTVGLSSNNPMASTIFHHQEAMAQNTATPTIPNFLTYLNSTYGISVQYPSDWLYKGSANASTTKNNNNSGGQVQPIVTFVPQDTNIHALVTVGTVGLPPIFKAINIDNMSLFASLVIDNIKQSTPGFQLIESKTTTVKTTAYAGGIGGNTPTIPAQKIVYTAAGPVHKTMAVYAIKGSKAFFISYLTETESIYSHYLPIAQKMIDSFQIVETQSATAPTNITTAINANTTPKSSNTGIGVGNNGRQKTGIVSPATTPLSTATSPRATSSSVTLQKGISDLNDAREQLLLAWNRTGFRDKFDTYVNSADGYGVYEEHKSNLFKPGEPIVLYVEPVGFTHLPIDGGDNGTNNNVKLYLIKMTAAIVLSDKQGNILLGKENIPLLNVISHNKNTELFMNLRVTQSSPFPAGEYVISYTVTDVPSGKAFKIVKEIVIAGRGGSGNSNINNNLVAPGAGGGRQPLSPANQNKTLPSPQHIPCPYGLPRQVNGVCPIIPETP
jgi:hypothetical protein